MNNKIKGLLIATWMFAALFGAAKSTGEQATIKATDQAAAAVQEVATNQEILTSAQQAGKVHAWKHAVRALKPDATSQMVRPDRRFEMAARKGQYTRKESKIAFKLPFSASSGATQGASALPKSIGGGFSLAAVSTIAVFTNTAGDPITGYTIGDTIVWTITSTDTVYLEIYVDDGDSLFSAVNDFSFDVDDKGDNKITFLDNDIDDEDTTAGTWKITLDTGELSEGDEFFHLQGVRLWFAFSTALGGYDGELSLDVIAPPTTTTVSGTITVEGVPVPNVLAVAFPMAAMMDGPDEGGPEIFFIAMSGPSGEYAINVDDAQAGGEFMIMAFDLFGLYWGMYPDPPYIEVYLSAGDNPSGLSFDFQPVNSVIKGQLTDAVSTLGIAGVRVRAGGGPQELQDTTDAEGYYRIPVAEGDYRVDVAERDLINMGYMVPHGDDEWFWVADNDSIVVDFETYATDATITGTVLWSDGSPAVDIEVWGGVQGFHTNSWTDASGFYTLQVSSELDSFEVTDKWDSTNTWWNIGYWVNVHEEDVVAQPDGHHVRVGADYVDFTLFCSDATLSGIVYDFFGNPAPWSNLWAYTLDD
ncbi:MAG: carboxypeptidase regulatory-like domain-containing protein, partial [Candidatus Marinimicrobia bacterium]|nr:carboxypeptidase regulatory-like domain-containing protein [Candidatus Neomarinimicrobiota bacterium]